MQFDCIGLLAGRASSAAPEPRVVGLGAPVSVRMRLAACEVAGLRTQILRLLGEARSTESHSSTARDRVVWPCLLIAVHALVSVRHMHPDAVTVVVRQSKEMYGGEIEELVAHRFAAPPEGLDPSAVSEEARSYAMEQGFTRITFDEHRSYTDAGASGSSVTFVLELLGAGATGVAMQELLNYIKARVSSGRDDTVGGPFRDTPTESLRDWALSEAERALTLPRGDLLVDALNRDERELRVQARSRSSGRGYDVAKRADGSLSVRRLP